jgi:hypothetical protein
MHNCDYVCAAPTVPGKFMCKTHSHSKYRNSLNQNHAEFKCKYSCGNRAVLKYGTKVYCANHFRTMRLQKRMFNSSSAHMDTTSVTEAGEEIIIEASPVRHSFSRVPPTNDAEVRSYRLDASLIDFLNNNRESVLKALDVTSDLENPQLMQSFMLANQCDIIKFLCTQSSDKPALISLFNSHFPQDSSMQRVWSDYVKFEHKLECVRSYAPTRDSLKSLTEAYLSKSLKSNEVLSFFFADLFSKCEKFVDSYFNSSDFLEYAHRLIEFKKHISAYSSNMIKISVNGCSSIADVNTNELFQFIVECTLYGVSESFGDESVKYFHTLMVEYFV